MHNPSSTRYEFELICSLNVAKTITSTTTAHDVSLNRSATNLDNSETPTTENMKRLGGAERLNIRMHACRSLHKSIDAFLLSGFPSTST